MPFDDDASFYAKENYRLGRDVGRREGREEALREVREWAEKQRDHARQEIDRAAYLEAYWRGREDAFTDAVGEARSLLEAGQP